jgi:uncharacterized protein YuzE
MTARTSTRAPTASDISSDIELAKSENRGKWTKKSEKTVRPLSNIEFRDAAVTETRDLDENAILDLGAQIENAAITVEHASTRAGIPQFFIRTGCGAPRLRTMSDSLAVKQGELQ